MRRRILNLAVLLTVLILTASFVAVLPVTGQETRPIMDKLKELHDKLPVQPPSLRNKVNAVMHQVEAGAFNGALYKLQNDVKNSIQTKVKNPQDLIALVNEIINLIKGITPPPPPPTAPKFEISATAKLEVIQGESNTTIITITSINNFTQEVALTNSTTASGITLSLNPSRVVPPANGTITSTLKITASDNATSGTTTVTATSAGLEPKSVEIDLQVTSPPGPGGDTTPPTIAGVDRSPETPAYNESVTVSAFVYDTGTGVKQVTLNYSGGSEWTAFTMTPLDVDFYVANIPSFPFDTSVKYRVAASDYNNNTASSILFSYTVTDPFPPTLRIDNPAQGSYLSGVVAITVFMNDQNGGGESGFGSARLLINNTVVKEWEPPAPSNPDTYEWLTITFGPDGVYTVKLIVQDKAGNVVEKSLTVTVDNTLPTAVIDAPAPGSYQRLSALINASGSDANFDKMELRIDDLLVKTLLAGGNELFDWNTMVSSDGVHSITLKVYDKAGNTKEAFVNVTVDNTPPSIDTPSWSPKEPAALDEIQVNVTASDAIFGSGVENVTLWFMNATVNDWQPVPMELKNGNWTATLSNQSDTKVRFFIQAFDRAGNMGETEDQFEFTIAGPSGVPLIWILSAIAIILVVTGGAIYYIRRRGKKGAKPSSEPSSSAESVSPPPPAPSPPPATPSRKPSKRRT